MPSGELAPKVMVMCSVRPWMVLPLGAVTPAGLGDRVGRRAVVVVLGEAVLGVDLHALEVVLHDEVHDAGDGVRAVDRRGAARHHVHAVDQGGGDQVQVRHRLAAGRPAACGWPSISTRVRFGAEAAQVDGGDAGRAVVRELGVARRHGRQVVQQRFRVDGAFQLELLLADRLDRADAGGVRPRDARTGDHDFLHGRRIGAGRRPLACCAKAGTAMAATAPPIIVEANRRPRMV